MIATKIQPANNKESWRLAQDFLLKGRIIICPTDTLYGFSALASKPLAVRKVLKIKKRIGKSGIIILVSSIAMLKRYARVNESQLEYLKKVWPGRVSVILVSKNNLSAEVLGEGGSVAVRLPKNEWLLKLITKLKEPIISTSVNLSGQPPALEIGQIDKYFSSQDVNLVIDAGRLDGKASKLIDLRNYPKIKTLRK